MTMKLSKRIPARTETVEFNWCKKDFTTFDESYRRVRGKFKRPGFHCRWCRRAFVDGEKLALAQPKKSLNWILCNDCADIIIKSETA